MIVRLKKTRSSLASSRRCANRRRSKVSDTQRRERLDSLHALGFNSHTQYLRSERWSCIRQRVLERDEFRCIGCGKKANQVHHSSYDYATMSGENLLHLSSSCGKCHLLSHWHHEAGRLYCRTKCYVCGCEEKKMKDGLCKSCRGQKIAQKQKCAYEKRMAVVEAWYSGSRVC